MSNIIEQSIINSTDPNRIEHGIVESKLRSLSLGLKPLTVGDPRYVDVHTRHCDRCDKAEAQDSKLLVCSSCRLVNYCSVACQKAHWKEGHKQVCSRITKDVEEKGKRIVHDLQKKNITYFAMIQTDDAVYALAKKHGLLSVMESMFRLEAANGIPENGGITQELITSTFKGNRESQRYTCACPDRTKEYILSSPTAWESLMGAILHVATLLTKKFDFLMRNECQMAQVHRAARDCFTTINLALIHPKVAKAIFFGGKRAGNKRTPFEAKEYALQTLAPMLQPMFRNDGEGFASPSIDHNETVQANVFRFTAFLSYWFRILVDTEHPRAFIDQMDLDQVQETMYETVVE